MDTNSHMAPNGSDKTASMSSSAATSADTPSAGAQGAQSNLRSQLTGLKGDLDTLISRASNLSDEELRRAYGQMMNKVNEMRVSAKELADQAGQHFNRGVETTSTYVKDRPMQSMAVAVGAGLLLGMLIKRR